MSDVSSLTVLFPRRNNAGQKLFDNGRTPSQPPREGLVPAVATVVERTSAGSLSRRVKQLPTDQRGGTMWNSLHSALNGTGFSGTLVPGRVPLVWSRRQRPCLPFPHPWNYREPIRILESLFVDADDNAGSGRHTVCLRIPGLAPFLATRDPQLIRAITVDTGDKEGQFDRDTLPSDGIARATGTDSLLYSNGAQWRHQKKLAASPFGKSTLFQPENFSAFFDGFQKTVRQRLDAFRSRSANTPGPLEVRLEDEIKPMMLEMLTNSFFGASLSYQEIRETYVPALEFLIDDIVRDTVYQRLPLPRWLTRPSRPDRKRLQESKVVFEQLIDIVLAQRQTGTGLWRQFKSDAPDEALRSNLRVFLAGALEATTSFASWTLSHLPRCPEVQTRLFHELEPVDHYSPEVLENAVWLGRGRDETLRLTPSLYFLPRRATAHRTVVTSDGRDLTIPAGTHIFLDVWHANRHEDHWGVAQTGYPALEFQPDRWRVLAEQHRDSKEMLHFGFGHGPRVCPGKHLGQLEVALVVGALVKLAELEAVHRANPERAGVSTKPADGCLVRMRLRQHTGHEVSDKMQPS